MKEQTMQDNTNICDVLLRMVSTTVVILVLGFGITLPIHADDHETADSLYIGDVSDDTVKRFDANTGDFQGIFVTPKSGGLSGPRGLIFASRNTLDVVSQNVNLDPLSGAILQYDGKTGAFLQAIVPATDTSRDEADPNAPYLPRGMVLWNNKVLFVAEFIGVDNAPGRLLAFTAKGRFIKAITPDPSILDPNLFHPRGVVVGPDGYLYVSNFPDLGSGQGGHVLRVNPETGKFVDVFISDNGGAGQLNRPEGLVFGKSGRLYVTSFRSNGDDTDSIRIYDRNGVFVDKIELYSQGSDRAFAQALLFGPRGFLYVPITGGGPDTGAVRRYNVATKEFTNFVPPTASGGPLGAGWYLTFKNTDPGTLGYRD